MVKRGGLGKGLDALIPTEFNAPGVTGPGSNTIPIEKIVPNPRQPRQEMTPELLQDLAASIREHGILQPLIVTQEPGSDEFVLIAGERRLRAATLAGLSVVPAIVRQASDQQRLELALIENVQRADLSPLETAMAYQQLHEEFGLSHDEISVQVGKSRVAVTNTLRLLNLPEAVLHALGSGEISEGHARALLGLKSTQAQNAAVQTILKQDLSVRQTEELVRKMNGEKPASLPRPAAPPEVHELEERLRAHLGTKVTLNHGKKGGTLVIHYYSDEELDALTTRFLKD